MTKLWGRVCNIIVANDAGRAIDLAPLHCTFRVQHTDAPNPDLAEVRVLNLSESTETWLTTKGQFTQLAINAGYDGNAGLIFLGEIYQTRRGRLNPIDTYLDIYAQTPDRAYNFAVVSRTLAAGYTTGDVHREVSRSFGQYGVTDGYQPDYGAAPAPRGRVLYGMTRDVANDLAASEHATWSILNGALQVVPVKGVIPGDAVVLNSDTGLIGIPSIDFDAIRITSLLNPAIRHGRRLQVNQRDIPTMRMPMLAGSASNVRVPHATADGFYRVLTTDHIGDTRGNDWYTTAYCWPLDETDQPGGTPATVAMDKE